MADREEESCHSRHFSRLIKSCFPNPNTTVNSAVILPAAGTSRFSKIPSPISSLPEDLLISILSRLPLSSLPTVAGVCRRWCHVIESPSFVFLRSLNPTLFAFSLSESLSLRISSLRLNLDTPSHWNDAVFRPIDVTDISHARLAAVGRRIYIITGSGLFVFDPWTGSVRTGSGTLFPRKRFAAGVVSGKIYVAGGSTRATAVEEYDPGCEEWRVVSHAPRKRYGCLGVGVEGIFYVVGGLKIGGASDSRLASGAEARVYASSMDLYDVETRVWLRSRAVPGGGCVVAACGAHGHVYVLLSHAVELSFWRFNARRKKTGFGEWTRMKCPPLPTQVRLDGSVRFTCIGWEEKVVLIQVMGCIEEYMLRRNRNVNRGYKEGIVLIFDCVNEEWSIGPHLPHFLQRPSCICAQC